MSVRANGLLVLAVGSLLGSFRPTAAQEEQHELNLPFLTQGETGPGGRLGVSLGSVGMDSRAGTSRWAQATPDPYRFVIPDDRSARKVPGFLVKIPFGSP